MNARRIGRTGILALFGVVASFAAFACSSSDEAARLPDPVPVEDGSSSVVDGSFIVDGAPDEEVPITDAGIDRRHPPNDGDSGPPTIVHEIWAGVEVACASTESSGTKTTQCWGNNRFGQLGRGEVSTENGVAFTPFPIQSPIASDIVQMAIGRSVCARTSDGALRCWAAGYVWNAPPVSTPPQEPLLTDVADVRAGNDFACALRTNGHVACWGSNSSGQLGLGSVDYATHTTPEEIPNFTAERIAVGSSHACALSNGQIWCWGSNNGGGVSEVAPRYSNATSPGLVPGLGGMTSVVAGTDYTCALAGDETVWCWGSLPQAQNVWTASPVHMLKVGFDDNDPAPDQLLAEVKEIAAGGAFCARLTNGSVACLGTDGAMIGYPDYANFRQTRRFTTVLGVNDAIRLVAGADHMCTLGQSGQVRCWGANGQGQLGIDPKIKDRSGLPVLVTF